MKKSYWAVGLAVIITALLLAFFKNHNARLAYPSAGHNIVAFGDSLVRGYGASAGRDFPTILSQKINEPIINAGKDGDTTTAALSRLKSDVLDQDPKVVIILLGGNDFLTRVPQAQTLANLRQIIDQIKARGAGVILVGFDTGFFGDYNNAFSNLARQERVAYVPDILTGIMGRDDLMHDDIHPNDQGYAIVAQRILPTLKQMLKNSP